MCEGLYHPSQFNFISYHSSSFSGQLYNADSMARISYYSASALPEVDFDATTEMVGAGANYQDGSFYIPVINSHLTQIVDVGVALPQVSFTSGNAYADVRVELYGELASIAGHYIRVAVVEDVQLGNTWYENVVRDMVPTPTGTPLTIQHTGEVQEVHLPFTMGSWNPAHMHVVAWVQRDNDKFIYNSTSSLNQPFFVNAVVDGPQQAIVFDDPLIFGDTTVSNYGTESDTYDITLDVGGLPAGWTAYFTHEGVDGLSATVDLDQFEATELFVTIIPAGPGNGRVRLDIYSHGAATVLSSLDFVAVDGNANVLLVADDGAADLTGYYLPSLAAANRTAAVWDQAISSVDATSLGYYDAVVWYCGGENPGLKAADRAALDPFLYANGRLLLTGQDLVQDLQAEGGSANLWFQMRTRCGFVNGNSGNTTISGVADDPISDGLDFTIAGGDGAGNQTDPDVIQCLTAEAVPIFRYGTNVVAGARTEYNVWKIVLLGFGFEAIDNAADRDAFMQSAMVWLIGGATPVDGDAPRALDLAQNTPNPFNPVTKISFALGRTGPVALAVYDLQGRLVRTLVSEPLTAGRHDLTWDGRDDAGLQAASGTYVYRLSADGTTLSRKMTLLK